MKKYLLSNFTFDDFKEMIAEGDNSKNMQIRTDKSGYIYLSQEFVGNENLEDVQFRLPTLDGSYIGSIELASSKYMKSIYDLIIRNKDKAGYVDTELN